MLIPENNFTSFQVYKGYSLTDNESYALKDFLVWLKPSFLGNWLNENK